MCRWQGCWQLSFAIPLGDPYVASIDSRSVHIPHTERADWLRGRVGEAGELVWCSMLAHALSGQRMCMTIWDRTCGALVDVQPWRTGGNRFQHAATEGFSRESI